ncbi:photoactive yellow protein [Duganella sp. 1411]|uniref:phosphonate transporter n=1 Tax=Duganella sp. 1411 TaxID=2806572 RepID=UPI001AE8F76C|nr:phosphonate transporter [Duganella sp. 1411]MBP1203003.1 photoactive yellow protein [Duganella sp. 1411]
MTLPAEIRFDQPDLAKLLDHSDAVALDALGFGAIGFDHDGRVARYNTFESQAAGLRAERVLGQDLFLAVAPCMNNFMVAQRFIDARADGAPLDDIINYVLTLRMRPTKVKLRLLYQPGAALAYVLVQRL